MGIQDNCRLTQTAITVCCHSCGHTGVSLWEDFDDGRQLVNLEGFYERLARKEPYAIETVCNNCGKVQPT